jgi:UDP-N-acetylmuramyl pentapeptide synthase
MLQDRTARHNNVHPAHLLGLGSIEGVAKAKGELFFGLKSGAIACSVKARLSFTACWARSTLR